MKILVTEKAHNVENNYTFCTYMQFFDFALNSDNFFVVTGINGSIEELKALYIKIDHNGFLTLENEEINDIDLIKENLINILNNYCN